MGLKSSLRRSLRPLVLRDSPAGPSENADRSAVARECGSRLGGMLRSEFLLPSADSSVHLYRIALGARRAGCCGDGSCIESSACRCSVGRLRG